MTMVRPFIRRRLALLSVFLLVLLIPLVAFAQSVPLPGPIPVLTPAVAVVTLIALVVGFLGQAINSGSVLGIATVPKAWIPLLTLVGSFLSAAVTSLQQAPNMTGTAEFNAVVAGFVGMLTAAGGAAIHVHLVSHSKGLPEGKTGSGDPPTKG
jgi:hypothetical protein